MMTVLLAALLFAADPTAAQAAPPAPAQAVKPKDEKKICKVDKSYTGSRMTRRLCLTETEWARHDSGVNAGDLKTMGAR
jgi:predicted secreted protein